MRVPSSLALVPEAQTGVSGRRREPTLDRELLCTVGDSAVMDSSYPPDKICMYLYYTDVIIMSNNLHGARVNSSWERFQIKAKSYKIIKPGASFDHRYITASLIKSAAPALNALKTSGNIGNFGVLNLITTTAELPRAVQAVKAAVQQIKNTIQGSHTVIAIGSFDYSNANFALFANTIKTVVDTFAADTVIAISSVNSILSKADCRAVPPNLYSTTAADRYPSLARHWPLLMSNATFKQTKTLGLSFEMGTLYYELESAASTLSDAVNAKCRSIAVTSRDAICGPNKTVDDKIQKLAQPQLTYATFVNSSVRKRVLFSDFKTSAVERYNLVSRGSGSTGLRSRVAWMLFNVHLEDIRKHCGRDPYEPEQTFCNVFLGKTC
ncbi:hypothetical protein MTO96_001568 [Rhipicephalus appendiculatus]